LTVVLVVIACQFAQQICGISPGNLSHDGGGTALNPSHVLLYEDLGAGVPRRIEADSLDRHGRRPPLQLCAQLPALGTSIFLADNIRAHSQSFTSKRLLLISSFGTSLTALLLGIGLNTHNRALSATSVFAFALSFSIGLAPIPWVVLPEVVPPEARTAGGAVAVSVNWLTNFAAASGRADTTETSLHAGGCVPTTATSAQTRHEGRRQCVLRVHRCLSRGFPQYMGDFPAVRASQRVEQDRYPRRGPRCINALRSSYPGCWMHMRGLHLCSDVSQSVHRSGRVPMGRSCGSVL